MLRPIAFAAALLAAGCLHAEPAGMSGAIGNDPLHVAEMLPHTAAAGGGEEIDGFAGLAGTTGGAGKPTFTVTEAGDDEPDAAERADKQELAAHTHFVKYYSSCPSERSRLTLRQALTCALLQGGGKVVFAPALANRTLDYNRSIYIPDNVTLDGGGVVTVAAPFKYNVIQINGVSNVIVSHLTIRQNSLVYRYGHCVDLLNADRVWIAHNDIGFCGEGGVYVNQSRNDGPDGLPKASNVTIAYNHIHDIGKVFAIGQLECEPSFGKEPNYVPPKWCTDALPFHWDAHDPAHTPFIHLTIADNLLNGVGERAPRVGAAYVDMVDNLIAFHFYTRATTDQDHPVSPAQSLIDARAANKAGPTYGGVASGGAHLFGTNNVYVSLDGSQNPALCTPQSVYPRCKSGLTLADGTKVSQTASVKMTGTLVYPQDVYADTNVNGDNTPPPPYAARVQVKFDPTALNNPSAWACIARHVGAGSSGPAPCGGRAPAESRRVQ